MLEPQTFVIRLLKKRHERGRVVAVVGTPHGGKKGFSTQAELNKYVATLARRGYVVTVDKRVSALFANAARSNAA